MNDIKVHLKRLPHGAGLQLPTYETSGSVGMDLRAAIGAEMPEVLAPGERKLIATGIAIALPVGYEAQVRPRSGLASRYGIGVLNSPGTIDADYRGEIKVILVNHGTEPFAVLRGERIAQIVIAPVTRATLIETSDLAETARGASGFGSSGTR